MSAKQNGSYIDRAREALRDEVLQRALADLQKRLGPATAALYRALPEGPELRYEAHDIRKRMIENLDVVLDKFARNAEKNGATVFFARDAKSAVRYCLELAKQKGVKLVVKGKSMVTEEIGLNEALFEAGIQAVETDLGEYIIQLAGERPSHILAPAIHKTRQEIGKLFAEKLGIEFTTDPPTLTWAARKALREKFLAADMGISGCNQACAETGHLTVLSNEGNIRMATTLPRIHVAFMGMERVCATLEEQDVILRLLCRAVAAQKMAGYTSYIGGPRREDQEVGPAEVHIVVVDNGRSRILADPVMREILCCIRCGACLNVCPVYGKIGGHTYGTTYCGPIGAVLTPLMRGISDNKDLCLGETLCGACKEACPVNIDHPKLLLELRAKLAQGDPQWGVPKQGGLQKTAYVLWAALVQNPTLYSYALRMMSATERLLPRSRGMIRKLPYPFGGWTRYRDMQPIAGKRFRDRWKELNPQSGERER